MLVLSRTRDQSIMIGDDIEVKIVDVRGDKVRLGFVAGRNVAIHRKEVYDAIRKENREAAELSATDLPGVSLKPSPEHTPGPRPPSQEPNANPTPSQSISPKESTVMDPFLRAAIDEAKKGLSEGGLPIGSVLVRAGKIIGRGHNQRVQKGDPMAHAEIDCLTNAGRQTTYKDTVLYSTLMPCYLCSGAAVQFGIPKVIVGESVTFHGGESTLASQSCGLSPQFMRSAGIEVIDLSDQECIDMMTKFIKENPKLWNEDIGV